MQRQFVERVVDQSIRAEEQQQKPGGMKLRCSQAPGRTHPTSTGLS